MKTYCDGELVTHEGRTLRINFEPDNDTGAPWENGDGHGPVSDWTSRDKHPGELILSTDRNSKRFYDFAAAMQQAKSEGWGLSKDSLTVLSEKLGRPATSGEIRQASVMRDYEHLRGWCNDDWHYVGVIVTDTTDDPDADNDYGHALWGVEDSDDIYTAEIAEELIGSIIAEWIAGAPARIEAEKLERVRNAGPELLAAAQNARNVLAALAIGDMFTVSCDSPALAQLRAAISKATGATK